MSFAFPWEGTTKGMDQIGSEPYWIDLVKLITEKQKTIFFVYYSLEVSHWI